MPPAKRAITDRPQIESSLPPLKTLEVPKEVLSLVLLHASQNENTSLVQLALVEKGFASIALPLLYESLEITSFSQLAKVVKHRKKKETKETKYLSIRLPSIYPTGITQASALLSLKSLFSSVTETLTSLAIHVPSTAHNPIAHLFPKLTAVSQLSHLTHFRLEGEIWFHDILALLSSWPSLISLSITHLRGDCRTSLPINPLNAPQLRKISIHESSLTGTMIRYLLASQHELRSLELPIPGGKEDVEGSLAWNAIENLVYPVAGGGEGVEVIGLEVLKVWDRWGDQVAAQRRKEARKRGELTKGDSVKGKGQGKATVKNEQEEEEESDQLASDADESNDKETPTCAPSPFLSILSSQKKHKIRSILLTTAYLPPSPAPDSFNSLLPHLSTISELTIEDTTSSGLRKLVEGALKKGKLEGLKELTSVGIKKRAVAVKKDSNKKQPNRKKDGESEDELESEEEAEKGQGKDKKEKEKEKMKVEKQFVLSKTDLKFEKFCKSKGVQWRIEETVW